MKIALNIIGLIILSTGFYTYVGQMVPQSEEHPPKDTTIRRDMTTEEMIIAGEEIASGKGTCMSCHTIGQGKGDRFPDLGGIGARASKQKPGMSGLDYLAESLYDPGVFIVEGYNPGMPAVHKAPLKLSDPEILCVIAYLQSLGGSPNITMDTKLKYQGDTQSLEPVAKKDSTGTSNEVASLDGKELISKYGCAACHSMTDATKMMGPSLFDLGTRMSVGDIYTSLMSPDATVPEGYLPGLMEPTLKANGFYDTTTTSQMKAIVDYLASLKGK